MRHAKVKIVDRMPHRILAQEMDSSKGKVIRLGRPSLHMPRRKNLSYSERYEEKVMRSQDPRLCPPITGFLSIIWRANLEEEPSLENAGQDIYVFNRVVRHSISWYRQAGKGRKGLCLAIISGKIASTAARRSDHWLKTAAGRY